MKPALLILVAASFLVQSALADDDRPILHESPQKLVALIDSSIRDVTAAAAPRMLVVMRSVRSSDEHSN